MRQGLLIAVGTQPGICHTDIMLAMKAGFPEISDATIDEAIQHAVDDRAITRLIANVPDREPVRMYFPADTRFSS